MEEENQSQSTDQTSSQDSDGSSAGKVIAIIVIVLLVLALIGLFYVNSSTVNKLKSELAQAQRQLSDIQNEQQEASNELAGEFQEGVSEIVGEIDDLESPFARLALTKAYAAKLRSSLSEVGQENLDAVILYVERTPTVLLQTNPELPADVQEVLTDLRSEIASARAGAIATSLEERSSVVGQTVTIEGELALVSEDLILGGSVFTITTEDGAQYYLHLNDANSTTAANLVGEMVTVTVVVTGSENGLVTYDVVSGPTAAPSVSLTTPTPAQ